MDQWYTVLNYSEGEQPLIDESLTEMLYRLR